jgi:hypothetical protein
MTRDIFSIKHKHEHCFLTFSEQLIIQLDFAREQGGDEQ